MKKVLFKRWIPIAYETSDAFSKMIKGTGCLESDYTHEGIFHRWGLDFAETNGGTGSYSVAIIEMPDGTIELILPQYIKFI